MSPRKLDLALIAAAIAMAVILLLATRSASAAVAGSGTQGGHSCPPTACEVVFLAER